MGLYVRMGKQALYLRFIPSFGIMVEYMEEAVGEK
jgi:hypothetical protein